MTAAVCQANEYQQLQLGPFEAGPSVAAAVSEVTVFVFHCTVSCEMMIKISKVY